MILLPYKCQVYDFKLIFIPAWLDHVNAVLIPPIGDNVVADLHGYSPDAHQLTDLLVSSFGCV